MGKKNKLPKDPEGSKKKKQVPKIEKFPIDAEVANFEAKYPSIIPLVDSSLVRRLYESSIPSEVRENGVSWNISTNFTVEKKFFLALKELVVEGDIDLEIAIVEEFMPIGRMLIRKLGYREDDLDHKVETAITNVIESYLGQDGFKSVLLKELKVLVKGKQEEQTAVPVVKEPPRIVETVVEVVAPVSPTIEEHERLVVRPDNIPVVKAPTPVLEEENEFIVPNDGKLRPPTTLDQLLASIDILKNSPLEDENYVKFLSLKYGYHSNQFFSLGEISEILSLSGDKVRDYYLQSLQFVKDWFGLQLDHYYTYLKKNGKANE